MTQAIEDLWGFEIEGNVACKMVLVHGTDDRTVPPSHSVHYHNKVHHSQLLLLPNEGHISHFFNQPDLVPRLINSLWDAGPAVYIGRTANPQSWYNGC